MDTKKTPNWNYLFIFHFLNALRLNNMQDTTLVVALFLFLCFWLRFNCGFCLLIRERFMTCTQQKYMVNIRLYRT